MYAKNFFRKTSTLIIINIKCVFLWSCIFRLERFHFIDYWWVIPFNCIQLATIQVWRVDDLRRNTGVSWSTRDVISIFRNRLTSKLVIRIVRILKQKIQVPPRTKYLSYFWERNLEERYFIPHIKTSSFVRTI